MTDTLRLRRSPAVARRSPAEWVTLAGAAAAWIVLLLQPQGAGGHHHGGADHAPPAVPAGTVEWFAPWTAMVVAMMWPLAVPVLSAVWRSSFPSRRWIHAGVVLGVTTGLWITFGVLAHGVALAVGAGAGPWWTVGWLALGAALTGRPVRARVLSACLRLPPIHPGGVRGLTSVARASVRFWWRCAVLCGPVMAAMALQHAWPVMLLGSVAVWWEQWHPRAARDPVPPVLLVAAAGAAVLGWLA